MSDKELYKYDFLKAPILRGYALKAFVYSIESSWASNIILIKLKADNKLSDIFNLDVKHCDPTNFPNTLYSQQEVNDDSAINPSKDTPFNSLPELCEAYYQHMKQVNPEGFQFETIYDFYKAYQSGSVTPVDVANRLISVVKSKKDANVFISFIEEDVIQQAQQSAQRWAEGNPLSIIDGVPVAVKDEVDQLGHRTTGGTKFMNTLAREDSTVVARLRAAGAILIGKTNMHEFGFGTTGLNIHHGTPLNPYFSTNPQFPLRFTGGSSSGSASAVSQGWCPIAIGADGGGSIRVPASLCGLSGIKSTFGRVSVRGALEVCWSVAHLGPIANNTLDAAIMYSIIAGPDTLDKKSVLQPPPTLSHLNNLANNNFRLDGIKIGIYRPWFEDAHPDIVKSCYEMLEKLQAQGAQLVDVVIPHLGESSKAHTLLIGTEMFAAMSSEILKNREKLGYDLRINFAVAKSFTSTDYIQCQRIRTKTINAFMNVLQQVDVIVTPTTSCTAPAIHPNALYYGESDIETTTRIMHFAGVGNLTGLPSNTFTVGYDSEMLPIGMQMMGRPWSEDLLMRVAAVGELFVQKRAPNRYDKLLSVCVDSNKN